MATFKEKETLIDYIVLNSGPGMSPAYIYKNSKNTNEYGGIGVQSVLKITQPFSNSHVYDVYFDDGEIIRYATGVIKVKLTNINFNNRLPKETINPEIEKR